MNVGLLNEQGIGLEVRMEICADFRKTNLLFNLSRSVFIAS